MPEGPSIVILKEQAQVFEGKKILNVTGNSKIDLQRLLHLTVTGFKSWGKHLLICFPGFTVRIHLMLFGSYRINEKREMAPRLSLQFSNSELNFYNCSVKFIEEPLDSVYDWSADLMSESWDAGNAKKKLLKKPETLVCDAVLNQDIFAGAGNIFKNEVLFRIKVHPESRIGALPARQLNALVRETHRYSFQFYEWKKNFVLKQHWLAHTKSICPRCNIPFTRQHLGKTHRRSFYCENCQVLYDKL